MFTETAWNRSNGSGIKTSSLVTNARRIRASKELHFNAFNRNKFDSFTMAAASYIALGEILDGIFIGFKEFLFKIRLYAADLALDCSTTSYLSDPKRNRRDSYCLA